MDMEFWTRHLENCATDTFASNMVATFILVTTLVIARYFLVRAIRKKKDEWFPERKMRAVGAVRFAFLTFLVLGLLYIWSAEVGAFAVSIAAVALAMVISVKEVLLCLNGGLFRVRAHLFDIGDRIEVDGVRGDVVEAGLLSTRLLEVGPGSTSYQHSGRTVAIPNSVFLDHKVHNESLLEDFFLFHVEISLKANEDWRLARSILLQAAEEECEPYISRALEKGRRMERKIGVEIPRVQPRVSLRLPDAEEIHLVLRFPTPINLKGQVEQAILERFMTSFPKYKTGS